MGVGIKLVLWLPRDAVSVPVALTEACANVIQDAGPGEEYEVRVSARNRRCVIEVVSMRPA